jgi:hypothetical protein
MAGARSSASTRSRCHWLPCGRSFGSLGGHLGGGQAAARTSAQYAQATLLCVQLVCRSSKCSSGTSYRSVWIAPERQWRRAVRVHRASRRRGNSGATLLRTERVRADGSPGTGSRASFARSPGSSPAPAALSRRLGSVGVSPAGAPTGTFAAAIASALSGGGGPASSSRSRRRRPWPARGARPSRRLRRCPWPRHRCRTPPPRT